jgi:hypothetical protein
VVIRRITTHARGSAQASLVTARVRWFNDPPKTYGVRIVCGAFCKQGKGVAAATASNWAADDLAIAVLYQLPAA